MRITRNSLDTNPRPGDWFTGAVYLDTIATPRIRRAPLRHSSTSRLAPARPGTLTPTVRRSSSPRGLAAASMTAGRSRRSARVTGCTSSRGRTTGTARANRFMAHFAMQEVDETGSPVTWGEHVSDADYNAA